jgi:YgiT-type zinc finger domain-containing protein
MRSGVALGNTCPVCGKYTKYLLKYHTTVWESHDNGQNFLVKEVLSWCCPQCGATLFSGFPDSEVEALKWLAQ